MIFVLLLLLCGGCCDVDIANIAGMLQFCLPFVVALTSNAVDCGRNGVRTVAAEEWVEKEW